jgi:hypothetical protein
MVFLTHQCCQHLAPMAQHSQVALSGPDAEPAVGDSLSQVLSVLKRKDLVLPTMPDVDGHTDVFDPKAPGAVHDDVIVSNAPPSLPVAFPNGRQQHLQVSRHSKQFLFCRRRGRQQGFAVKAVLDCRIGLAPEEMQHGRKALCRKPEQPQLESEPFPAVEAVDGRKPMHRARPLTGR